MSKTITGVVTWLRNWFYTKSEVDSLITTGGSTVSIEDTDLSFFAFSVKNQNVVTLVDCIKTCCVLM